ncbi:hypothetical protein STEG23_007557, partial [Scotinomys teguina]
PVLSCQILGPYKSLTLNHNEMEHLKEQLQYYNDSRHNTMQRNDCREGPPLPIQSHRHVRLSVDQSLMPLEFIIVAPPFLPDLSLESSPSVLNFISVLFLHSFDSPSYSPFHSLRPKGPRSTQTAVDKDDSRAPRPHWTKRPTLAPLSETKMGRRQCKSTYNIIKNKTTPESSPPPTPRSDHCNADKAGENDLKKSLMKMLEEAFEEKMKNVSKEIGENTNKKLE